LANPASSEQQAVNNEPGIPNSQANSFHLHSREQVRSIVARFLDIVENRKFSQNIALQNLKEERNKQY